MDTRLRAQGFVAQTDLKGQTRLGGELFGGYRWRRFAAELGYAHLGRMDTVVQGLTPVDQVYLRAISAAHPRSGRGPQLSALMNFPLNEQWEVFGRAGLFYWQNTLSAEGFGRYADIEGSQLDPFFGGGLQIRPFRKKWMLAAELRLYRLDGEIVGELGVAAKYRLSFRRTDDERR